MNQSDRITTLYRAVIAGGGAVATNRDKAIHLVAEQVQPLIDSGELVVDTFAWVKTLVLAADRRDGQAVDKVLVAIGLGEDDGTTEGATYLDHVATLGRGGRKVYRFLTASDLDEMDELRHKNVRTVNRSYHRDWKPAYDAWRQVLRRNVTIGNAVESGDLPLFDMALFETA